LVEPSVGPDLAVVFLDALVILALGVRIDGRKEVLGLWLESTEGAKLWLEVITELKNRGVEDIFIACCDGLKGSPVLRGRVVERVRGHRLDCSIAKEAARVLGP
jgi:transposase-like protein